MLRLVGRDLFVGQHAMLATEGPKIDRLTDQLNATAQHADEARQSFQEMEMTISRRGCRRNARETPHQKQSQPIRLEDDSAANDGTDPGSHEGLEV